jgi:hypothetical protein
MSDSLRAPSSSVDPKLICDVGFYHGFDTAHYLDRGFRVVATDGSWTSWDDLEASWRRCFPNTDDHHGTLWFDLHASLGVE